MKDIFNHPKVPEWMRTIQIICAALVIGVVMFMGVAFFVSSAERGWHTDMLVLFMAATASCYLLSFVVPSIVLNSGKAKIEACKTDEDALKESFSIYQTSVIVGYALIEGAIFGNLVAFFVTGSLVSVAVAGVGLVLMIARFPLPGRILFAVEELVALKK
ncbi:MAG: hypothetical protein AAF456_11815 [Planctomycetota bacterium]